MVLRGVARAFDPGERVRLLVLFVLIAALHVAGLAALFAHASVDPTFLGLGGLAYAFGLRQAFDADHISAIDNTTRKLLQERKRPVAVGFFFSIGHATVVFLIALALGFAAKAIVEGLVGGGGAGGELKSVGATIGTTVSGVFLVLIGLLNLLILLDIVRVYQQMRRGEHDRESLQTELTSGGFMTRLFGRLFKLVSESWHMYLVGLLFGFGFDT